MSDQEQRDFITAHVEAFLHTHRGTLRVANVVVALFELALSYYITFKATRMTWAQSKGKLLQHLGTRHEQMSQAREAMRISA